MPPKFDDSAEDDERWIKIACRKAPELMNPACLPTGGWKSRFYAKFVPLRPRSVAQEKISQRVLWTYLATPRLREKFPVALLSSGRARFFRWLIKHGRRSFNFTDEEILSFLKVADAEPAEYLLYSYLIQPSWQKSFPHALSEPTAFLDWISSRSLAQVPSVEAFVEAGSLWKKPASHKPGVNLLGHFCFCSGLREASLQTRRALEGVEFQVVARDIPCGGQSDTIDRSPFLAPEIFPTSIMHVTPNAFYKTAYERAGLFRKKDVYRIGVCFWELPEMTDSWLTEVDWLDEVWAPTEFIASTLERAGIKNCRPMLPGVALTPFTPLRRSDFGLPEDGQMFIFMFDMCSVMERKNPLGLIEAFRLAFPKKGRTPYLVIKVSHGDADPAEWERLKAACDENEVYLLDEVMTRERSYALLDLTDAYVSLHRSEGFGLSMAEAMLLGKPVVATGYSGNLDFMHQDNSLLVDVRMVSVKVENTNYPIGGSWAQPDSAHAATHLRWIFDHPDEACELGKRAQKEMQNTLSLSRFGQRMAGRLREIEALKLEKPTSVLAI